MFGNLKHSTRQLIGKRKIIMKIRFGTEYLEVKEWKYCISEFVE